MEIKIKKIMNLFAAIIFVMILQCFILPLLPSDAQADCGRISNDLSIDIPSAEFASMKFRVSFDFYINPADPANAYFKLKDINASFLSSPSAFIDNSLNINITCAVFQGSAYSLLLQYYPNPNDSASFYWKLINAGPASDNNNAQNQKPTADSISLSVDSTLPYIVQQLSARDPDNDTITYQLISDTTGTGYTSAYINPLNGKLYLAHKPSGNDSFTISFRVTDGQLFSDPANVSIKVNYLSDDNKETGKIDVPYEEYSSFALSDLNSQISGAAGESPTVPRSIDLSANFPKPGDQGNQSSCVGWAAAYALKSYQEKVELGWSLNTQDHLFSPAFIYNQINGGQDQGSYIYQALDLAVNRGICTLASMPYSDKDYRTQPASAAFTEASKFKAASWKKVTGTDQIKAALANKKPVVGGIAVYQQLIDLSGSNSVYNTASGSSQGGHAVTLVGYDDDKYGGAFKIINSWSQNWGDNGFFWMPYSFAAKGIMSESYVLEDAENSTTVVPVDPEPTEPEPDYTTLPNFSVIDWDAAYDPRPRGNGGLTYTVENTGSGIAYAGADINLMLSDNAEFTINDYYVVYENIPFNLNPGAAVYRDSANTIPFRFPDQLPSGTYYMALWVDDLNIIQESNENDNVSIGSTKINIQNTLPDLNVKKWYADWDSYGNGTLTYEVINSGASSTATTDWYINLILHKDQKVDSESTDQIYLFYEYANFILKPGEMIYRTTQNPAYFNLYKDYDGYPVPAGTYYMALWVDDMDSEAESNETNNGSFGQGTVTISNNYGLSSSPVFNTSKYSEDKSIDDSNNETKFNIQNEDGSGCAYNGKKLPPSNLVWKKVEISRSEDGGFSMTMLDSETNKFSSANGKSAQNTDADSSEDSSNEKEQPIYAKTISAKSKVIYPSTSSTPMPSASAAISHASEQ